MSEPQLTVEQSFEIHALKLRIQNLSKEETQNLLVQTYELMLRKDAFFKKQLGEKWGILPGGNNGL